MKQKTSQAARLTLIRKQSGLTQAKFARLLHVARGTYANYEAGRQKIPRDRLEDAISVLKWLANENEI